ncbi:MAG: hypothetical protein D6832_04100 [Alphaproteobacteria bacterium]|nr:MAG: hypothetical protein D6832_04100 [Alphaproteobacteria bacterium]
MNAPRSPRPESLAAALGLARGALSEAAGRSRPRLELRGPLAFTLGRVHELCGPARRTLAAIVAGALEGPVLWMRPARERDRLNPEGLAPLAGPERFIFADILRAEDALWCLEETLRSGLVPLVVAELPAPPGLTPVRRLQLAAEAGAAEEGGVPPLGLLLTPGDGGAPGVESRWWMAPCHRPGRDLWRLELRRARGGAPPTVLALERHRRRLTLRPWIEADGHAATERLPRRSGTA